MRFWRYIWLSDRRIAGVVVIHKAIRVRNMRFLRVWLTQKAARDAEWDN